MKLHEMVKKLQSVMKLDFDERAIFFEKYRDILRAEISANPSNIESFCIMAMITCELREDAEKSIEILEQCYLKNKSNFSDEGFALWATDMAYFLLEECGESSEERAVELLSQAINRNSNYASTYYAYGKVCFGKKDFKKASGLFCKAFELSEKKSYKYCEAVSLLAHSNQNKGITLLKSIYSYPFQNEEVDVRVALTLGRELAISGNIDEAKKIAQIYICSQTKRLKDIRKEYDEVFIHSVDILPDVYYDIVYGCYYIYCPRHYL
jgi:tetratricopeptide (TPR) repeat protein